MVSHRVQLFAQLPVQQGVEATLQLGLELAVAVDEKLRADRRDELVPGRFKVFVTVGAVVIVCGFPLSREGYLCVEQFY